MSISANVIIMTKDELEALKHKWFQKGVERGRFEERYERNNPKRKQPETKPEHGQKVPPDGVASRRAGRGPG